MYNKILQPSLDKSLEELHCRKCNRLLGYYISILEQMEGVWSIDCICWICREKAYRKKESIDDAHVEVEKCH